MFVRFDRLVSTTEPRRGTKPVWINPQQVAFLEETTAGVAIVLATGAPDGPETIVVQLSTDEVLGKLGGDEMAPL